MALVMALVASFRARWELFGRSQAALVSFSSRFSGAQHIPFTKQARLLPEV